MISRAEYDRRFHRNCIITTGVIVVVSAIVLIMSFLVSLEAWGWMFAGQIAILFGINCWFRAANNKNRKRLQANPWQ